MSFHAAAIHRTAQRPPVSAHCAGGRQVGPGCISFRDMADASNPATTAEDRCFGVHFAGGIDLDHIQYGTMARTPVPEPASWALLAAGLLGLAGLRRTRGSRSCR